MRILGTSWGKLSSAVGFIVLVIGASGLVPPIEGEGAAGRIIGSMGLTLIGLAICMHVAIRAGNWVFRSPVLGWPILRAKEMGRVRSREVARWTFVELDGKLVLLVGLTGNDLTESGAIDVRAQLR